MVNEIFSVTHSPTFCSTVSGHMRFVMQLELHMINYNIEHKVKGSAINNSKTCASLGYTVQIDKKDKYHS